MQGVTVVDHPLVQHKLTLMRDAKRSTKGFRQLLNEIGMLLAYEVTRDLPLEYIDIETPLTAMSAPQIAGKTAAAEVPLGRGRVLLFGFRPQYRGQSLGTFKLLFNAILNAPTAGGVTGAASR